MCGNENISNRDKAEIQAGADLLLHPGGGGIAIWVRRDELLPPSAIRFHTQKLAGGEDIESTEIATILAALQVGLEQLTAAMAREMGMPLEVLVRMRSHAAEVLGPRMHALTEVRR